MKCRDLLHRRLPKKPPGLSPYYKHHEEQINEDKTYHLLLSLSCPAGTMYNLRTNRVLSPLMHSFYTNELFSGGECQFIVELGNSELAYDYNGHPLYLKWLFLMHLSVHQ